MSASIAGAATLPKPPGRVRAVTIMAGAGVLTGLLSSLPSPLPDLRLENPEFLINAKGIPLHAGVAFAVGVGIMLWRWANRNLGKCLLAMVLTVIGWLAAVNTASDVMAAAVGSELFGTVEGAKAARETVGWILAGLVGGGIGAGLISFGAGVAAEPIRRFAAWGLIVATGMLFGLLLYPAARLDAIIVLFVPWQAAVLAAIAYGLTRPVE
jgi:hypothetical protein